MVPKGGRLMRKKKRKKHLQAAINVGAGPQIFDGRFSVLVLLKIRVPLRVSGNRDCYGVYGGGTLCPKASQRKRLD